MRKPEEQIILAKLGRHIAQLRKDRKLSVRKLAQNCSTDHSRISLIEKGLVNVGALTLIDLAHGLDCHPSLLLNFPTG
ncbi:helix-turn-helix domain-containing protein [Chitinophaga sp. 22321]|uniref:helix-turn-helix domain-containing protein n=1 Tax=Chitinophaga sp. 22321 TaxID=3453909 RepID=UPI003F847E4E